MSRKRSDGANSSASELTWLCRKDVLKIKQQYNDQASRTRPFLCVTFMARIAFTRPNEVSI